MLTEIKISHSSREKCPLVGKDIKALSYHYKYLSSPLDSASKNCCALDTSVSMRMLMLMERHKFILKHNAHVVYVILGGSIDIQKPETPGCNH